jgi:transcriptional regulator with XRE-family HTH domain
MEIYEKLKLIRSLKSWTQEEMANKLGISPQAYAKIERGKTDAKFSRLQQIADVMEIDLPKLLELDEKNVFNLTCDHNKQCKKIDNNWHVNSTEQTECKHELEKARLIIEQREKEIDYLKQEIAMLKQQISDFRNIINLLKKPEKPEE